MLAKFAEAIRLLSKNLVLFSSIIFTVWLPGNVLVNYLAYYVYPEDEGLRTIRITMFIEAIFGPIYVAAMIHALSKLKEGERPRYLDAMAVGFRNWGRLFVAQLLAGLLIGLGFIALVVPGVVLLVRYALLDEVVVLEGAGTDRARRRSTELTTGVRWQIFWAGLLFSAGFLLISYLSSLPMDLLLERWPLSGTMAAEVALDCVLDVTYAIMQIVMFLYYWQAVHGKPAVDDAGAL